MIFFNIFMPTKDLKAFNQNRILETMHRAFSSFCMLKAIWREENELEEFEVF